MATERRVGETDAQGIKIQGDLWNSKIYQLRKLEMLIRKPVSEVFEAFVDPAITSKFWFSKGSGRLEEGKQVQWDWEMHKFSVQVNVKEIETNKRILVEWLAYGAPTLIQWPLGL